MPEPEPELGVPTAMRPVMFLDTDTNGDECWRVADVPAGLVAGNPPLEATDQANRDRAAADPTFGPCQGAPAPSVGPDDARPALRGEAEQAIPLPTFSVQPGNEPLTGKASYLDGPMQMQVSRSGIPITLTDPTDPTGTSTISTTADLTATMVDYWVDWSWAGGDVRPNGADVRGPYRQAPRPWRDGNPGNVAFTYERAGQYTVAVQATWRVTANVAGLGAITPIVITTTPGTTTVQVRQAQAVRQR